MKRSRALAALVGLALAAGSARCPPAPPSPPARVRRRVAHQRARGARRRPTRGRPAQPVKFSFAASSALARQLEAGARADVFLSADLEWMDYVQARGLIDRSTRRDLLGNRLVLIAPASSTVVAGDRAGLPARGRHSARGASRPAIPTTSPSAATRARRSRPSACGATSPTAWCAPTTCGRRSPSSSRGEAPLGIVYDDDAKIEPGVRVVGDVPRGHASADHVPGGRHARRAAGGRSLRGVPARRRPPGRRSGSSASSRCD